MENHPPLDPCLTADEQRTFDYFKIRPHYTQRLLWSLEIQGDRITAKTHSNAVRLPPKKKRGRIGHFSAKSRLRMLKKVSSVEWEKVKAGLFISLTYPDQRWPRTHHERNDDLTRFAWYMENHLKAKIPILWRCEWQVRKSGEYTGQRLPHFHLLCFRGRWIDWERVRGWWARIIEWDGPLSTDIDGLGTKKKIAVYIAKYCAKCPSFNSLDYVPYPKVDGRHWGTLRPKLVPYARKVTFAVLTPRIVERLRYIASMTDRNSSMDIEQGFSMIGQRGECWRDTVMQMCIDEGCTPLYDN